METVFGWFPSSGLGTRCLKLLLHETWQAGACKGRVPKLEFGNQCKAAFLDGRRPFFVPWILSLESEWRKWRGAMAGALSKNLDLKTEKKPPFMAVFIWFWRLASSYQIVYLPASTGGGGGGSQGWGITSSVRYLSCGGCGGGGGSGSCSCSGMSAIFYCPLFVLI